MGAKDPEVRDSFQGIDRSKQASDLICVQILFGFHRRERLKESKLAVGRKSVTPYCGLDTGEGGRMLAI